MKHLLFASYKISKNYAWEVVFFNHIRSLKDGITFWEFSIDISWYKDDHNPKFSFKWVILNWMLIEFNIYNINHAAE